ncbi:MAG: hypothetical protein HYZ74_08505 [Elusimicrobia bacterium]|nr:hypothetical protein [Elusimicrobiota bacterium]
MITSRFFRDAAGLDALARAVRRLERKPGSATFRAWIPSLGAGEDVYSAAFILMESLKESRHGRLRILATGPEATAIARARRGVYSTDIQKQMSPARLRRYFTREAGGYRIQGSVRERCVFAVHNFAEDLPFVQLDAVICALPSQRWPQPALRRAMDLFYFALKPGGLLLLENGAPGLNDSRFTSLSPAGRLYKRPLVDAEPRTEVQRVLSRATGALRADWRGFEGAEQERLQERQDELVAMVSHELRTPLAVILGFTETLRMKRQSRKNQTVFLEMIEKNARRLRATVESLVGVVDTRARRREASPVAIAAAARETTRMLKDEARRAAVTITLRTGRGLRALIDPADFPHILENLVGNAIKYNRRGGRVIIRAARRSGEIALSVADTGIGIPAESIGRVFDRFFRCPTARHLKGTGIGLSIVRSLVEANDGRVAVESAVGKGTTFRVFLPAA